MVAYISNVAVLITSAVTIAFLVIDRKILYLFKSKNATSPLTAITFKKYSRLINWRLRRMAGRGFLFTTELNYWYLDQYKFNLVQRKRRQRMLVLLPIVVIVMAGVYYFMK
ncbi:hypothetical protein JW960_13245 [candidate division KSB1 bacterium]|nr:hypothetical protein [candidate division KSB1 bacterium]